MNSYYEVSSFSSMMSCKTIQTTFSFQGNFYTSQNGSIPRLDELQGKQKISSILFFKKLVDKCNLNKDQFVFKRGILDSLSRESNKFVDTIKYQELKENNCLS